MLEGLVCIILRVFNFLPKFFLDVLYEIQMKRGDDVGGEEVPEGELLMIANPYKKNMVTAALPQIK